MKTREDWNTDVNDGLSNEGLALNSASVAEWKLFRDLAVTIAMLLEWIYTRLQSDVEYSLANKQVGSIFWYTQIARQYQHGDSLTVTDGVVAYGVIDASKQIIAQVAVKELFGDVVAMKVARIDPVDATKRAALTSPQLTGFRSYIDARRLPGTKMSVISLPPNERYYEVEILKDATYDSIALEAAILSVIQDFRDSFRFDAIFYKSQFVNKIGDVPGVIDVNVSIDMISASGTVPNVITSVELPAGYFNYNSGSFININ